MGEKTLSPRKVFFATHMSRQKMIQIVRRHSGRRILRSFFADLDAF
jgi:hypothetical protein